MNPLAKAKNQYFVAVVVGAILIIAIGVTGGILAYDYFNLPIKESVITGAVLAVLTSLAVAEWIGEIATAPLKMINQAASLIAHNSEEALPRPENLSVASAITQEALRDIYDITTQQHEALDKKTSRAEKMIAAINNIGAPVFSLDRHGKINFFNSAAEHLANPTLESLKGSELHQAFSFDYIDDVDLDSWLDQAAVNKIHDCKSWQRVRLKLENEIKYFDMNACYTKNDSAGHEVVVTMLDFTDRYRNDEKEISFVSLAVHELRSPLTVLRGYIEVFQDEVGPQLSEEYVRFMNKMSVSAGQLSTFVNNILNVSRIENEQMSINPQKLDWGDYLDTAYKDFKIRAEVRGRNIKLDAPKELPEVAADPVSVYEVLSNLIDNAIKYTDKDGQITIATTVMDNGYVETTVTDDGIGIPGSIIEHLFEKFYRSHRSRENIGGTGLGLFLSKQIIEAHQGEIWVKSKEGEGSTFGFTLPTYESAKEFLENPDRMVMKRSTHGWIKNHGKVRK